MLSSPQCVIVSHHRPRQFFTPRYVIVPEVHRPRRLTRGRARTPIATSHSLYFIQYSCAEKMAASRVLGRKPCSLYKEFQNGLVDYERAWRLQRLISEKAHSSRKSGTHLPDSLIVLQHSSVYTIGRGGTVDNLKFKPNDFDGQNKVYRTERGGEVTWHGPGQIVCYPIFDLNNHKKDLHWFANNLEQTVINAIAPFGIKGERSEVNTGVWVGKNKVCAIGVTASRWITMHGLAVNVSADLNHFGKIIPCGIADPERGVCTLQQHNPNVTMEEVAQQLVKSFAEVFELEFEERTFAGLEKEMLHEYPEIASAKLDLPL